MLKAGDRVPDFSLATDGATTVSAKALRGQRYVLYFYPKDDTPGCTKEACAFRDNLPKFGQLKVPLFGVSADDEKKHAKFVAKYALNFPLLADPDHQLIKPLGVWVEKSLYGRKYFGIARCTFVIAADGRIEKVWEKVSPAGHAQEVLDYLNGAASPQRAGRSAAITATKKPAAKKPAAKKSAAKKLPTKQAAAKPVGATRRRAKGAS